MTRFDVTHLARLLALLERLVHNPPYHDCKGPSCSLCQLLSEFEVVE